MSCCPCCCENEELPIRCSTCGIYTCKKCFLTCEKCYKNICVDCEAQDFLCEDCLGNSAEGVAVEEDDERAEEDYSLYKLIT